MALNVVATVTVFAGRSWSNIEPPTAAEKTSGSENAGSPPDERLANN